MPDIIQFSNYRSYNGEIFAGKATNEVNRAEAIAAMCWLPEYSVTNVTERRDRSCSLRNRESLGKCHV